MLVNLNIVTCEYGVICIVSVPLKAIRSHEHEPSGGFDWYNL